MMQLVNENTITMTESRMVVDHISREKMSKEKFEALQQWRNNHPTPNRVKIKHFFRRIDEFLSHFGEMGFFS